MSHFYEVVDVLQLELLARLVLAVILGGLIGMERQWAGKSAGLRTHILICMGSALFTEMSISVATLANNTNASLDLAFRSDPARIAAQVVTGVGFLGGGAILRGSRNITGLTTAATVWVVAAVGMAIGAGAWVTAIGTTALVLFVLFPLRRLEQWLTKRFRRYVMEHPDDAPVPPS